MLTGFMRAISIGFLGFLLRSNGLAQSTRSSGDDNTVMNELGTLRPLATSVITALESGNLREAMAASDKLTAAVRKIQSARNSPRSQFALLEKQVESDPRIRNKSVAALAYYAARAEEFDKARAYAYEALGVASRHETSRAENVYYANQVLGLLALRQDDVRSAARYLLASLDHNGWKRFAMMGPNVLLAQALLDKGEVAPVIEFFEKCKPLWPSGENTLAAWQAVIRSGGKPDMYRNLIFRP